MASSASPRPGARKRVPNFSAYEKALIAVLVKKYPILKSKQTDGKSVEKKKLAWESISTEFNSNHHVFKRDTMTLKTAWDNMKASIRKARASNNRPPPPLPKPQQFPKLDGIPIDICEIQNSFDSDGIILSQLTDKIKTEQGQAGSNSNMIENDPLTWKEDSECDTPEEVIVSPDMSTNDIGDCVDGPRRRASGGREADIRGRHFENKKAMEMQILKAKLEVQEIKTRAAKLEEETNKINLEIAKTKLKDLENRLEN